MVAAKQHSILWKSHPLRGVQNKLGELGRILPGIATGLIHLA
jgi:hypothetical protein